MVDRRPTCNALFLDQTGHIHDGGFKQGAIAMLKRLQEAYVDIILGGEMPKDFLLPYVGVYTDWGAPWVRT